MAGTLHRKRALAHGTNAAIFSLATIGILIVGYILVDRFRPFRKDFTQSGLFSLSPKTVDLLKRLDRDVKVTYFSTPPSVAENAQAINQSVEDMLTEYNARSNRRLTFVMSNPLADAERLEELGGDVGAAVFQSGEKKIVVQSKELVQEDMESGEGHFSGEEAFDSAILRLVEGKTRTACFLTGHGEPAIEGEGGNGFSLAKEFLRRENLVSKVVSLSGGNAPGGIDPIGKKLDLDAANVPSAAPEVPADCTVLIVAGPQAPIGGAEADAIVKFWDAGGGVLLLAEPMTKSGIESLAARFGVEVLPGITADPQRKLRSPLAILPSFARHEIMDPLTQVQTLVLFSKAVGLRIPAKLPDGVTVEPLMQTSAAGLELVDIKDGTADPESKKNIAGPILVGVAIEKKVGAEGKSARAVVLGDSDFAANASMQEMAIKGAPGNIDLFKNSVAWSAGATEKIGIGPKSNDRHPITIDDRSALMVLASTALLMPGLIFATGISIWARRRRR